MRKICITLILIGSFIFPNLIVAQDCDFKIIIQAGRKEIIRFGLQSELNYIPRVKNNRMFLQTHSFESILIYGGSFQYDANEKSVTIISEYNNIMVSCIIDSNIGYVNGKKVSIDKNSAVRPYIVENLTMLPLRFIFENLYPEGRIDWDVKTKTATLIINDYECDNFSPDWAMQDGNPGKTRNIPEYSAPRTGNLILHDVIKNFDNSGEPIIFDGKLFVNQSFHGTQLIDLKEKKIIWSANASNQDELMIFISSPAYKNGKIVINGIKCGNAEDGKIIWKKEIPSNRIFDSDSIIYGNNVYSSNYGFEDDNYAFCNDLDTGNTIWEFKTGFDRTEKIAIADGRVFLFQQVRSPERQKDQKQKIRCLSAENGTVIWEKEITSESMPRMCADKDLVVVDDLCLDTKTGKELWKLPSKMRYLAMSDRHIIQSTESTICYSKLTGKQVWSNNIGFRLPVIAGSKVFGLDDKFIYCFSTKDGNELWRYGYSVHAIPRIGNIRQMVVSNGYIMLESIYTAEIYKEK